MKDYKEEAEKFRPYDKIKLLFIAESPPPFSKENDKRYFYYKDTTKHDNLFRETTNLLLSPSEQDIGKYEKLKRLQELGFYLIDACQAPIKKSTRPNEKKKIIRANIEDLFKRLKNLEKPPTNLDKSTPIVLITKPVYCIVLPYLLLERYNVLNAKYMEFVNFPRGGNNTLLFRKKLKKLLPFINLKVRKWM